jgi:hypothetical protein
MISVVKKCPDEPGRVGWLAGAMVGCVSAGGVPPTLRVSQISDYLSTRPVPTGPIKGPSGGLT